MAWGPRAVPSAQGWISPLATEAASEAVAGRMGAGQEESWDQTSVHLHGVSHIRRPSPEVVKEDSSALWGLGLNLVGQSKPRA